MSADDAPVFVDTNVLVYAFDQSAGEKRDRARSVLDQLWSDMRGRLSIQVLQEFYVAVTQKVPRPMEQETAAGIVRDLSYWRLHAPVTEDVLGAIGLQQRYMSSFWDAMIIWSAQQLSCGEVWSEDLREGQDYDGVRVANPFRG
jgi:predicted nucleic acid-binding protein